MKTHEQILALVCILALLIYSSVLRKRVERLEDRSARIIDVIDRHLDGHLERLRSANENSLTITNASERTITVTMPASVKWKEH